MFASVPILWASCARAWRTIPDTHFRTPYTSCHDTKKDDTYTPCGISVSSFPIMRTPTPAIVILLIIYLSTPPVTKELLIKYHHLSCRRLFFSVSQLLNIDCALHLEPLEYRWLVKLLTGTKLLYDTCFLKFSFEFLQGSFDVLAFLNWYNNHFFFVVLFGYT